MFSFIRGTGLFDIFVFTVHDGANDRTEPVNQLRGFYDDQGVVPHLTIRCRSQPLVRAHEHSVFCDGDVMSCLVTVLLA